MVKVAGKEAVERRQPPNKEASKEAAARLPSKVAAAKGKEVVKRRQTSR